MSTTTYVTVPAGTRVAECRGCGMPIYWITTKNNRPMPVDCEADEQCHAPDATTDGSGISHHATCPQAARFRKAKR